ncbi:MAG: hypothetical protein O3B22_18600 [Proteobacteria bacterium]|nr:hypothetical protein [Pseudomonadota bacterium]MDA1070893.1 hypothetical protein [Pseudomonadota bacterium]
MQVADPQHEFGDGDGTGVELQPQELVGIDRVARQFEAFLRLAQSDQRFQHDAFQAFEQFQGDIEEIARAAGRVQHAGLAELPVELPH